MTVKNGFTGGEPTLLGDDFFRILRAMKRPGCYALLLWRNVTTQHRPPGAEGSDGFVHPDHRDRESDDEDRTGEPRIQYQTPALPAAHRGGMIDSCLRQGL
jgi:hypothetical protein